MLEPSPREFVEAMLPAVRQAAAIARALEGRVANRPKPGESRPAKAALTIADTAAQEALLVPLWERFPKVGLEAEEDTESAAYFPAHAAQRVVVDPIDGTLHSYLEGGGPYAVMLGLARRDEDGLERYRAALVALPREELLLDATVEGGVGVSHGSAPRLPAQPSADGRRLYVSHFLPSRVRAALEDAGYETAPACGGAIAVAPLLAGVCGGVRLAQPGDSISVRGRIGAFLSRRAGAKLAGRVGAFADDLASPADALLVAADDAILADLQRALARAA